MSSYDPGGVAMGAILLNHVFLLPPLSQHRALPSTVPNFWPLPLKTLHMLVAFPRK